MLLGVIYTMINPSIQSFDNDILDSLLESIIQEIQKWNNTHEDKVTDLMQEEIIQRKCNEAGCDYDEDQLFEIDECVTKLLLIESRK